MQTANLLDIIQHDVRLKRASQHRGGEYHGPCPFCGGEDRFRVQPEADFWACRQCGRSGDAVSYLVEKGALSPVEAYKARHGDTSLPRLRPAAAPPVEAEILPPAADWQSVVWDWVADCQDALWSDAGARALAWLRDVRGLSEETLRAAGVGYNAVDGWRDLPGGVKVAGRGVVLPWFYGPDLWAVNVRRAEGDPRYICASGSVKGLYNADALTAGGVVVLVEGEVDALTVAQEAVGLNVCAVATGGAGGGRAARWVRSLYDADLVLLAFDNDKAGDAARAWWRDRLASGWPVVPVGAKDVNGMHALGPGVLRGWIEEGVGGDNL